MDAATRRRRRLLGRFGWAVLSVGILLALAGLIVLTGLGSMREAERDTAAGQARSGAAPAAALCRSPSPVVPVLRAAGVCQAAEDTLANPVIAGNTPPLTPAEVSAIVARVLPLTPVGAPLVPSVLDVLAGDPTTNGLDEASTRAVVAGAVGQQQAGPDPDSATQAPDPNAGDQYSGVRFERDPDGMCRGITTYTRPDGSTREETSAAPEGSCASGEPDPPPPPPPSSEPPPPPPSSEPPPPPPSETAPESPSEPAPDSPGEPGPEPGATPSSSTTEPPGLFGDILMTS